MLTLFVVAATVCSALCCSGHAACLGTPGATQERMAEVQFQTERERAQGSCFHQSAREEICVETSVLGSDEMGGGLGRGGGRGWEAGQRNSQQVQIGVLLH